MKASSAMDLNPESEILNPEAQEPQADPPSPEDQSPVLTAAKVPNGSSLGQADAGATEPSTSPKKPKRKYRTSDKVRASSPATSSRRARPTSSPRLAARLR